MTQTTVLIVGAGPTGLTLACELARRDVPFRLVDSAPGPQPGSRGKGVQPRTLEVFENLGVVGRVLAHGRLAMPIRATGPDGAVRDGGGVPESLRDRPDVPYPTSLVTPQWRVEEALRLRLSGLGGRVEFGTAVVGIESTATGAVASFERAGRTTTLAAPWVIGCDGGHSTVRRDAGIAFEGETREDVRMLVADVRVDGLERDVWRTWRHAEGFVSLCPLPSTTVFQYQASVAEGQDAGLAPGNLQAILDRRTGRTDIRLHAPEWSSLWRANVRLADRYREGAVLLAGDAAHVHSPAGGQGMNTGIQDAANLAWKLAAVARHGAPVSLIDTYAAERRPVALGVLALSDARLAQVVSGGSPVPTRRDASTVQLDVNYRWSRLARDDRDGTATLRAGDRAPDATDLDTIAGPRRLFPLLRGGRFTLLDFGAGPTSSTVPLPVRTLHVVDRAESGDDISDTAGHLRAAYAAGAGSLVLIRPDGYIGMIADAGDHDAIADYLADVGVRARRGQPSRHG